MAVRKPGPAARPKADADRLGRPSHGGAQAPAATVLATQPSGVPTPPRALTGLALSTWVQVWTQASWLTDADAELVMLLAQTTEEQVALREDVMSGEADWRSRNALRTLDKQRMECLQLLALTPADRRRLSMEVQTVAEDELEAFRRERRA